MPDSSQPLMMDGIMLEIAFESILMTGMLMGFSLLALFGFFGYMLGKMRREKHPWLELGLILLLAVALRLVWIVWTQPVTESDFNVYWQYAHRIAQGDFSYEVIERHPGIMLIYAFAFALLGPSMATGWAVNVVFSVLFLGVLYKLTQELFGVRVAMVTLVLGAILPQFVSYTALMASEIPAVTFFLMLIWAFLQTRGQETQLSPLQQGFYWAGMGLVLYGAIMVRSTAILLLGLIPLTVLLMRRDSLKAGLTSLLKSPLLKTSLQGCAVMVATCGLLLSTWMAHQYVITGVPKLFYGSELWLAFTTQYDHRGSVSEEGPLPFSDKLQGIDDGTMQGRLRKYQVLQQESLKVIQADPLQYLRFGFVRMKGILWGAKTGIVWSVKASPVLKKNETQNKFVRRLTEISTHSWRVLLALAPLGLLAFFRTTDPKAREGQALIWMFIGIWLVFHYLIAVASERYAFQIMPFVLMLTPAGLGALFSSIWRKRPAS